MDELKSKFRANLHRDFRLKHRTFYIWKKNVCLVKELDLKIRLAEKFHRRKLLEKCFYNFFVNYKFSKRQKIINAYLKSNIMTLYRVIYVQKLLIWLIGLRKVLLQRFEQKILSKEFFYAKFIKSLQPFFNCWRNRTKYSINVKKATQNATIFHETLLIKHYFHKWQVFIQNVIKKRLFFNNLHFAYNAILLKNSFTKWRKFTGKCKSKHHKTLLAQTKYENKLLLRTFISWKTFYGRRKYLKLIVNKFEIKQDRKVTKVIVHAWKLYSQQKVFRKEKIQLVELYYNTQLIRKTFSEFLSYYKLEKLKYSVHEFTVRTFLSKKIETFSFICFRKWKKFVVVQKYLKRKHFQSEEWNKRYTLKTFLRNWCTWVNYKKNQQIRFNAAEEYRKYLLKRRYFQKWNLYKIKEINLKNALEEHKREFNKFLIKFCFKQIENKAREKEGDRLKYQLEVLKDNFYAKLHFFKKWKYFVWENVTEEKAFKSCYTIAEKVFQFDVSDVRVLKPKIPSYFEKKNSIIL